MNISPHIDTKKCKSPEQLLPFPWEKAAKQKKFDKEVDEVSKKLRELGILKDSEPEVKKDPE